MQSLILPARAFAAGIGLMAGGVTILFAVSLANEDQRQFISCRASGQSVDACLLQIHGR